MLVLSRKESEAIHIGNDIKVTILEIHNTYVRVGIDAPKEMNIAREEILIALGDVEELPEKPPPTLYQRMKERSYRECS